MSVDRGACSSPEPARPAFLALVPGMTAVARIDYLTEEKADKDWGMGQVIHCGGAARGPKKHNLFQVADVDSGVIRWVNADLRMQLNTRDEQMRLYAFNFGWLTGGCTFYAGGALSEPNLMFTLELIGERKSLSPEIKEQTFTDIYETKKAPECTTALKQFESNRD